MDRNVDNGGRQTTLKVESDTADRHNHNGLYISLIILTSLVYSVTLVFNGLAAVGQKDLFLQTVGSVSDKFPLEITPSSWAFFIWTFIFSWLAAWLIYSLTTICRKDSNGNYIYLLNITPPGVYIVFVINNLLLIAWLFLFDRELFIASLVIIFLIVITVIVALWFSYVSLDQHIKQLRRIKMVPEIWSIRLLLQNGLAFYVGWLFVATLLNLSIVMAYHGVVTVAWSSTISLIILAVMVPVYFSLDVSGFTFATYIPIIIALAGSLNKNFDLTMARLNSIFTLVLLVITSVIFLIKLISIGVVLCKKPRAVSQQ